MEDSNTKFRVCKRTGTDSILFVYCKTPKPLIRVCSYSSADGIEVATAYTNVLWLSIPYFILNTIFLCVVAIKNLTALTHNEKAQSHGPSWKY